MRHATYIHRYTDIIYKYIQHTTLFNNITTSQTSWSNELRKCREIQFPILESQRILESSTSYYNSTVV